MIDKCVYLKKDKKRILYVVKNINEEIATITGVYYRILKTCLVSELVIATELEIEKEKEAFNNKFGYLEKINTRNNKFLCGKILHIDGDNDYLNRCLELYKRLGIFSYGIMLDEKKIPCEIEKYIIKLNPDVVVITGHDSYNGNGIKELDNYTNTKYFSEAVKVIRKNKSKDELVVIAGACQSNFEALIASGANFASSPKRLNIHTFDPAILAIKVATTDFKKSVSLINIERLIENGKDAFGGIETLGKMRMIL